MIILIMKKVAYLLGNGATMAELESKDRENRLHMDRIAEEVAEEAVKNDSSSHLSELLIKADTMHEIDVEELISIYIYNDKNIGDDYKDIPKKLQTYFRNVVIGILKDDEGYKNQNLSKCLLRLHKKYNEYMSDDGNELIGILTLNFDSIFDNAFSKIYDGANYHMNIVSEEFKQNVNSPALLKLHGSFIWKKGCDGQLHMSSEFESVSSENSEWLPPNLFKYPSGIYTKIWENASKILQSIDVLIIIGCSLRKEDWALISMIYQNQLKCNFKIDIVNNLKDAEDIKEKFPYLKISFDKRICSNPNPFKQYLHEKYDNVTKTKEEDDEISKYLGA